MSDITQSVQYKIKVMNFTDMWFMFQRCGVGGRVSGGGRRGGRQRHVQVHIDSSLCVSNSRHRTGTQHAERCTVLRIDVHHNGTVLDDHVYDVRLGQIQTAAGISG